MAEEAGPTSVPLWVSMVQCSLGGSALRLSVAVPPGLLKMLLTRAVAAGSERGPCLRHRACEPLIPLALVASVTRVVFLMNAHCVPDMLLSCCSLGAVHAAPPSFGNSYPHCGVSVHGDGWIGPVAASALCLMPIGPASHRQSLPLFPAIKLISVDHQLYTSPE